MSVTHANIPFSASPGWRPASQSALFERLHVIASAQPALCRAWDNRGMAFMRWAQGEDAPSSKSVDILGWDFG